MGEKLPSPCIDVCKFRREGRCIGCAMTKDQKKQFKKLDGKKKRRDFIVALIELQAKMGKYRHWEIAYRKKCAKKDVAYPAG